jgi:colanic acid/amylovoran biosynthesis glycosyltransferase
MERGETERFYDEFSKKLLADYVYGNPRLEAAIRHCHQWIPNGAKRILDIGCGIGWSTYELKRNYPDTFFLGIDITEKAIGIAKQLFGEAGLHFAVHDITQWSDILDTPFDAIVMLDVYEHIPHDYRGKAHEVLYRALSAHGRLILTFPSLFHQAFLRAHQPQGLQPIDEDVRLVDVLRLAEDMDGTAIYYKHIDVWNTNDYVHLVIQRQPKFISLPQNPTYMTMVESKQEEHKQHVMSRLGINVTREGLILPNGEGPTVCVINYNKCAYSETFIRAHIERLPAKVKLLYGGWFPTYAESDRPLLSSNVASRIARSVLRRLLRLPPQHFQTKSVRRFLETNKVDAVLTEYGPAGLAVMDVCLAAGVPFVVHFHGYDAYEQETLDRYGLAYQRMFNRAGAVIAVSRDMEQQLLALGAPREKLFYNPYGVDTSLFSGANPASAPPIFVAVGRFADKKAPHLTLLAFKQVLESCPEARLMMIGDGNLWEACKQLGKALRLSASIEFLGPRPHTEVAATMRQARAFVQHSLRTSSGDSEGTPVAVLEAGATGLPVVATRHAGIRDAVIEAETGFLVDEGDVEGMAACMIRLAKDPTLAAKLGSAGRERICVEFPMGKSINSLWHIIERAIQEHRNS